MIAELEAQHAIAVCREAVEDFDAGVATVADVLGLIVHASTVAVRAMMRGWGLLDERKTA